MRQTVVAVFEQAGAAERALRALREAGFAESRVQVSDVDRQADADRPPEEADEGLAAYVRSFFAEIFGPHEEHHVGRYAQALGRGHAVVKVDVEGERELAAARQALEAAGAIDLHQQPNA